MTDDESRLVAQTDNLPTMAAPEQVHAWSLDADEVRPAYGGGISTVLAALVIGFLAVVVLLGATYFGLLWSKFTDPSTEDVDWVSTSSR
jgi:hypothetical protein